MKHPRYCSSSSHLGESAKVITIDMMIGHIHDAQKYKQRVGFFENEMFLEKSACYQNFFDNQPFGPLKEAKKII